MIIVRKTEREIFMTHVSAAFTLDAPTFNSNLMMLKKTFEFKIHNMKNLPKNRILVTLRFLDTVAKTKFEDFLFNNADF